jgi:isoamylase
MRTPKYHYSKGTPLPLGASKKPDGWNFSLFSNTPIAALLIAPINHPEKITRLPLAPIKNKTGALWHLFVHTEEPMLLYAYETKSGQVAIDPYAKLLNTQHQFMHAQTKPLFGIAFEDFEFDWQEDKHPKIPKEQLIIYEVHLRGFTKDRSSHVHYPGTCLGFIEKIPYLTGLGITALEFLPLAEFDETAAPSGLCNFWGYSPLSFFAPMRRYCHAKDPIGVMHEFKTLIRELHKAGISVIIDVVFNHSGEGNEYGPTISWKAFAESDYYLKDKRGHFLNFSGCGNSFFCTNTVTADMIIDALRYWVTEFHVDGFRFDLASILTRGPDVSRVYTSLVERISQDAILRSCILIAEAWDAVGMHQVGAFYRLSHGNAHVWSEWNDDYRSVVRCFIKGTGGYCGRFATKLCGSDDLYSTEGSPINSINYITSHDGYTMHDLVSYQQKHNLENKEQNRDGSNANDSWNCGYEGETDNSKIIAIRKQQMKNFLLALFVSSGVPMLFSGDEYGHTKQGNNNTWCLDTKKNWFLWDVLTENLDLFEYCQTLIKIRKENPLLERHHFYKTSEIEWHGFLPHHPDWSFKSQFIAFTIKDLHHQNDLYVAFNAYPAAHKVTLPKLHSKRWHLLASSSLELYKKKNSPLDSSIILPGYCSCLLQALVE